MIFDIRTNNVPRDTIYGCELTEKEREEFDYLDWTKADEGSGFHAEFFRYKGQLYDIGEATRLPEGEAYEFGWQGYYQQSAFHAVIIKFAPNDQVIVGQIFS